MAMIHTYDNIDQAKIDGMVKALKALGSLVIGDNPWEVDTQNHGVKLCASWSAATSVLAVEITNKNWYVPEGKVWDVIDPLIQRVQQGGEAE